jgi:hypothetical protein
MPRPDNNYISVEPGCYPMRVPLVIHFGTRLKAHCLLVEQTGLLQICLRVCHRAACHVNFSPNLDTLLVPERKELLVPDL